MAASAASRNSIKFPEVVSDSTSVSLLRNSCANSSTRLIAGSPRDLENRVRKLLCKASIRSSILSARSFVANSAGNLARSLAAGVNPDANDLTVSAAYNAPRSCRAFLSELFILKPVSAAYMGVSREIVARLTL
jgi:hypothetical protein